MDTQEIKSVIKIVKIVVGGAFALFVLTTLAFGSWATVQPGQMGVIVRLGKVVRIVDSGFTFKFPMIEHVVIMDTQIQKYEAQASAYSKDTQTTETKIALNYHLKKEFVGTLYKEIGTEYLSRLVDPAIQEAVKTATAKFSASELIEKRPVVKEEIKAILITRLNAKYIAVDDFSVVDFSFSNAYEQAIDRKQVALQDALTAKNKLDQVEYEAKQTVTKATADAEAIRISAVAINSQGGADYVQLQAIKAWDGKLPTQMVPGATVPFINLTK